MGRSHNVKEASFRSNVNNVKVRKHVAQNHSRDRLLSSNPQEKIRRAQRIADDLTRKFGPASENCYAYFCKCAYNLSENTIWNCYEDCIKPAVKNHLAYFLTVTKAQPEMKA